MNGKTASILAVGIIIAAFVWGAFFISARNEQSIRVVGQGVKTITSDIIKWNILYYFILLNSNIFIKKNN